MFSWHGRSGATIAIITKSIGTSSRDYSTITAWEADLDTGALYASGDTAVGECYDDSAFDEAVTINGGGTVGLAAVTLSVAAGQRHDGTAGTGARIVRTGAAVTLLLNSGVAGTDALTVEWLELDGGDVAGALINVEGSTSGRVPLVQRVLAHGIVTGAAATCAIGSAASSPVRDARVQDCVVYAITANANNRTIYGINLDADQANGGCLNNTVYGVTGHGTGAGIGVRIFSDSANGRVRNNISAACAGTSPLAFSFGGSASLTSSNNLSDDVTADDGGGSGHLISQTAADLFVSTTGGSEDLHLKAGSPAIDAGVDLVTTPTGVNLDIDGRDRDAEGDTWDIGADEYVAAGASVSPGAGTLTMSGFAPSVALALAVTVGMGMVWNTAFQPTVSLGSGAAPGAGALTITGAAPTVSLTHAITPGAGVVTIAGLEPTVAITSGIVPSTGAVAISGYAPTVQLTLAVTPSTGTVVLTGLAPAVQLDRVIAPSTGAVTITGEAPTAAITAAGITPATGALTTTGFAPVITTQQAVAVGAGVLTLTGYAATVTVADLSITFVRAAFTAASPSVAFTGKAPSVTFTTLGP